MTDPAPNVRFVITHRNREGIRTLTFAQQGRNTYATQAEAQTALDAFLANSGDTLVQVHGEQSRGTFEVRSCECWPGHNDPKGVWFEDSPAFALCDIPPFEVLSGKMPKYWTAKGWGSIRDAVMVFDIDPPPANMPQGYWVKVSGSDKPGEAPPNPEAPRVEDPGRAVRRYCHRCGGNTPSNPAGLSCRNCGERRSITPRR